MKKFITRMGATLIVCLGLSLGVASTANATQIVDTKTLDAYVGWLGNLQYSHNINPYGFVPGTAISGTLEIEIWDERDLLDFIPEVIVIVVEALDFDTGGITFGSFMNDLEVEALASLNQDGLLDVKIQSILGDFKVHKSVLTVDIAEVPEPAAVALLGLGLIGFWFGSRRLGRV